MFPIYFTAFIIALKLAFIPAYAEEFTVSKVKVNDLKAVYATVESRNTLLARARIGGTINTLEIDEGDAVKKGQVLAVVGDRKLAIQIEASGARVQSARATWNKTRVDLDRATELYGNGTIPKTGIDAAKTAFNVADHNLAAMVKERDVIVQQAREGAILAPADGRVLKVKATNGEVVLPGEVVVILASGQYLLRINLPERHARFLAAGDKVLVAPRGKSGTDAMRQGRVELVYPQVSDGKVTADVAVKGLGDYFVGERTLAYISTGIRETYVVPKRMIYYRFGLSYIRLKNGVEVVVQVGNSRNNGVEILSGLKDGDVVVSP